jgi:hypothetical protein
MMDSTRRISMSMKEVDRFKTIQAFSEGHLKAGTAASRLALSRRQVDRLRDRYRNDGPAGLVSGKRGQQHHQLPKDFKDIALSIIRERYPDFGPTLAAEKLRELHGIRIGKETVRKLMMDVGLWIPRRLRSPKVYQPRNRRQCVGELIQIDGSDHAWFEERAPACTLLVYIDDATSRLMHLHFTYSESTFSYFEATRAYIEQHGKPQAFYSDQASVFRCAHKAAKAGEGYTQFGRAMFELNIESICANSSQAKGRVERANGTLQDRLVKELRLRGIDSLEAANAFVPTFIEDHNRRFAKPPRNDFDTHRPVREDEDFTWRELRKVSHVLTLQYDKKMYLLADQPDTRRWIGKYIDIYEYPDGRIEVRADGNALPYVTYDRLAEINQGAIVENKRLGHVLRVVQTVQQQRDNRRSHSAPARTNQGKEPFSRQPAPGTKAQRQISADDVVEAIQKLIQ